MILWLQGKSYYEGWNYGLPAGSNNRCLKSLKKQLVYWSNFLHGKTGLPFKRDCGYKKGIEVCGMEPSDQLPGSDFFTLEENKAFIRMRQYHKAPINNQL